MACWTETYNQTHRPTMLDIQEYLHPKIGALLIEFNQRLFRSCRVKAIPAHFTNRRGWVIPYRLRGVTLFTLIILDRSAFLVDKTVIRCEQDLEEVLIQLDHRCQDGFLEKVEAVTTARKERARRKRSSRAAIPERRQHLPPPGSDPDKLNKYHWMPALAPAKLRRLYSSSAEGMLDHELLEDVGISLYLRCQQGTEAYALLCADQLKCHGCGAILPKQEGLMICACGQQYTFQEHVDSFNRHRMPGGNALHVFVEYVEKWPRARNDSEKMMLIDWMIHQCHISMASGLKLRSVSKNLIDASQKTADKLILELAYGDEPPTT